MSCACALCVLCVITMCPEHVLCATVFAVLFVLSLPVVAVRDLFVSCVCPDVCVDLERILTDKDVLKQMHHHPKFPGAA